MGKKIFFLGFAIILTILVVAVVIYAFITKRRRRKVDTYDTHVNTVNTTGIIAKRSSKDKRKSYNIDKDEASVFIRSIPSQTTQIKKTESSNSSLTESYSSIPKTVSTPPPQQPPPIPKRPRVEINTPPALQQHASSQSLEETIQTTQTFSQTSITDSPIIQYSYSPDIRRSPETQYSQDIRRSPEAQYSPDIRRSPETQYSSDIRRRSPDIRRSLSPENQRSHSPDIQRRDGFSTPPIQRSSPRNSLEQINLPYRSSMDQSTLQGDYRHSSHPILPQLSEFSSSREPSPISRTSRIRHPPSRDLYPEPRFSTSVESYLEPEVLSSSTRGRSVSREYSSRSMPEPIVDINRGEGIGEYDNNDPPPLPRRSRISSPHPPSSNSPSPPPTPPRPPRNESSPAQPLSSRRVTGRRRGRGNSTGSSTPN
ncbi:hypothetical protein Glove_203g53 [Diversispora epigaea]|uniref:Uncharacterized protein n=1 Tax=Diversispora epigaea TaxID=1348612 RepID=A0A397IJB2_9GLOM|nr:hypothetical protein Glove_203g53 [Diversispora epigaea]